MKLVSFWVSVRLRTVVLFPAKKSSPEPLAAQWGFLQVGQWPALPRLNLLSALWGYSGGLVTCTIPHNFLHSSMIFLPVPSLSSIVFLPVPTPIHPGDGYMLVKYDGAVWSPLGVPVITIQV